MSLSGLLLTLAMLIILGIRRRRRRTAFGRQRKEGEPLPIAPFFDFHLAWRKQILFFVFVRSRLKEMDRKYINSAKLRAERLRVLDTLCEPVSECSCAWMWAHLPFAVHYCVVL